MGDTIEFEVVARDKFDSLPEPAKKAAPDRYDALLNALSQTSNKQDVRVFADNEQDLRGKRITIGRKARQRGFIAEFRNDGLVLYVRKSGEPVPPPKEKEGTKKNKPNKTNESDKSSTIMPAPVG